MTGREGGTLPGSGDGDMSAAKGRSEAKSAIERSAATAK